MNVSYQCSVRLLDDAEILECQFSASDKGSNLLDHICEQLNLVEKDYFGLRYVDNARQRHWLDLSKPVMRQIKDMDPILFNFRVKFYPPDPFKLKEDITRYHIFLQLKRDLVHGRLYCTQHESSYLAALIIQAEFGDYDPDVHSDNYVAAIKLLLKQTQQIEEKIMEIHQEELKAMEPPAAENTFLKKAVTLDTYGIDPHPVKDHKGNQLYLGINYQGILTFQGIFKLHHFRWPEVNKLKFEGKMFIIHLIYREKKHTVGFKCPTVSACRHVWRCAIEQMLFFTVPSSSSIPSVITGGSIFSFGGKFRYSGRVEKEVLEDNPRDDQPSIVRSNSLRVKASSVPDTPMTPLTSDIDSCIIQQTSNESRGFVGEDYLGNENMCDSSSNVISSSDIRGSLSDYFFHESLGHSYSESHLMRVTQRLPRIPKPMPLLPSTIKPVHSTTSVPISSRTPEPLPTSVEPTSLPSSKFHFMKVFWPSFITALMVVLVIIVMLLETDTEAFSAIRQMPEMVTLRIQYYEQIKQYFKL
ncbi:hypothetical protein GE061_001287 [Apolygus lucorum]|uniref:Moesin/ezrin/radixin homolog 1 n=1 Tax=Apolygus lucorum TaxID=248454 RepID=A0A8S9YAA0_APOLU|nr:hypothetical protein GE061_001287 [Apolygus lucorum]